MKVKTSELIGPALDRAVAKCEGLECLHYTDVVGRISSLEHAVKVWCMELPGDGFGDKFSPSTEWDQGGPIIERERVNLNFMQFDNPPYWTAYIRHTAKDGFASVGPTPLVAAMRCYVVSKLGEEVDIPEK